MNLKVNIPFNKLNISPEDIYREMGYNNVLPDSEIQQIVFQSLRYVTDFNSFQFLYTIEEGNFNKNILKIKDISLNIGAIIGKQLKKAEAYALFVVTAGDQFEQWLQDVKKSDDILLYFIVDSLGSCLAEKIADYMEVILEEELKIKEWKHTNRFSPGYCNWNVSEQQRLFRLFPISQPCNIQLTSSSLMIPIKSISGIIGLGSNVNKKDYSCSLCSMEHCYKRKNIKK